MVSTRHPEGRMKAMLLEPSNLSFIFGIFKKFYTIKGRELVAPAPFFLRHSF